MSDPLTVSRPSAPSGTIAVADAVELAVVERSGFVESRHAGAAIVLDPEGVIQLSLGDVDTPILPPMVVALQLTKTQAGLIASARAGAAGLYALDAETLTL